MHNPQLPLLTDHQTHFVLTLFGSEATSIARKELVTRVGFPQQEMEDLMAILERRGLVKFNSLSIELTADGREAARQISLHAQTLRNEDNIRRL